MRIYEMSRGFPDEEKYSLTTQMRRSSRSVCANIAEGWQKRRYPASFRAKIIDAAGEADETRSWLDMALHCGFLSVDEMSELDDRYNRILGQLIRMAEGATNWRIK